MKQKSIEEMTNMDFLKDHLKSGDISIGGGIYDENTDDWYYNDEMEFVFDTWFKLNCFKVSHKSKELNEDIAFLEDVIENHLYFSTYESYVHSKEDYCLWLLRQDPKIPEKTMKKVEAIEGKYQKNKEYKKIQSYYYATMKDIKKIKLDTMEL